MGLRWYTTAQVRQVTLIRPGLAPGPPSPSGKALGGTGYRRKVQHFKFVRRCESLPRGGRWLRSRRMRATPRKHSVVYQRRPPTPQKRGCLKMIFQNHMRQPLFSSIHQERRRILRQKQYTKSEGVVFVPLIWCTVVFFICYAASRANR